GAKRKIGDAAKIDITVEDRSKPSAQRRALGAAIGQRHHFISNLSDVAFGGVNRRQNGTNASRQPCSEKQGCKFPATELAGCFAVHRTSKQLDRVSSKRLLFTAQYAPKVWKKQDRNALAAMHSETALPIHGLINH
ncbi:MAG TPA: hypothetical protein PKV23_08450, partial [Aestuariivirga sp.]|nr:hypothetical protein [Aestuariivirga sp.]